MIDGVAGFYAESPYYSELELKNLGARSVGRDTQVSRGARFFGFRGRIGDRCRIDEFAVLKGDVELGDCVHLCSFSALSGVGGTIRIGDFCSISLYCAIYSSSDFIGADHLLGSLVPSSMRETDTGDVSLGQGVFLGAHSIVLPNAILGEFTSVGAHCIVQGTIEPGTTLVTGAARPRVLSRRRNVAELRLQTERARRELLG